MFKARQDHRPPCTHRVGDVRTIVHRVLDGDFFLEERLEHHRLNVDGRVEGEDDLVFQKHAAALR